jgi:2-polyprenyl-6-methoxyphenol hydroxylase-like FAD-dependent oxidoreductase
MLTPVEKLMANHCQDRKRPRLQMNCNAGVGLGFHGAALLLAVVQILHRQRLRENTTALLTFEQIREWKAFQNRRGIVAFVRLYHDLSPLQRQIITRAAPGSAGVQERDVLR